MLYEEDETIAPPPVERYQVWGLVGLTEIELPTPCWNPEQEVASLYGAQRGYDGVDHIRADGDTPSGGNQYTVTYLSGESETFTLIYLREDT